MCDRSRDDRRVSTTWAWRRSSNRAQRTAAGRPSSAGSSTVGTSAGGPWGSPRRARAARTSLRLMRRGPNRPDRFHGAADPCRTSSGRGMSWAPPLARCCFGPVRQPASTFRPPRSRPARRRSLRRRPAPACSGPGGGGGQRLEQVPESAGLERGHDPARGEVAALPVHPRLEQFGRVGGRSIHGDQSTGQGRSRGPGDPA